MNRRNRHRTGKIAIILLGVGQVGGTLLRMLASDRLTQVAAGTRVVAVADSRGALIDPRGLTGQTITELLEAKRAHEAIGQLHKATSTCDLENILDSGSILVDATDGDTFDMLRLAYGRGCGIVLANKRPLAEPWSNVEQMFADRRVRYEATVGAGLPVISTMRSLIDCKDRIDSITGVLSGTIGYLCSQWEQGVAYSEALLQARTVGYTEPDPRDDLSGRDVARKALILARTAGWALEMSDIEVEPLFPAALVDVSVDEFLHEAHTLDDRFTRRVEEARTGGHALRYMARVDSRGGKATLCETERESPIGILNGPGNAVIIKSHLYNEAPLVISGPGAGPEVTAAGVLGDVLHLVPLLSRTWEGP